MQGITFSNQPCQNPLVESRNLPGTLSVDLSFANSLTNTIGAKPSIGQFLLTSSQIAAINLNGRHTAIWTDDAGRTATAYNLVVTREPIKTHYSRKTNDKDSCFLVEVSDARWLCKNPTFSIAINKQYNVKAPGYQGQYYQSSTNAGTAWTWTGMVENIWNLMSSQLGTYPGLPITPNGTPEGFVFPGCSAWDALTEVLNRIGCAVRWNPAVSTSQYSIVQIGATDTSQDAILANAERRLIHDAEFQPVVLGKIPYGVRVFFHRQELDYGTERTTPRDTNQWQSNAVYSVDVVGPDSATAESGVYHPIWDDLPAIYNASGSLTNSSALNTRAQERSDDFYRMLRSVGGQRLYQAYSGVVLANPGSTVKEIRWRLDGQAAIITEVIRHPFMEIDRHGMTQKIGNLNLNQPFFGPGKPVYSQVEQIIRIANGTPSGGVYDSTIEQLTTAPSTWMARESIYVVDLGGASSLSAGSRYKGRLVGYHSSRPLYAINTANTSGMVPTGDYTITGNWVIEGDIQIIGPSITIGVDGSTTTTIDGTIVIDGDFIQDKPPSYSDDTFSLTTDDDELSVIIPVYYIDGSTGPFYVGGFPKPGLAGYTDRIVIVNRGSEPIEFPHQNVPTTAANRITTKTYTTGYLPPSGVAEFFYDTFSLTWRPGFGLDYQFNYYNISGDVNNLNVDWGHGLVLIGDGSTDPFLIYGFNNVPWGRMVHIFNSHYGTITIKHNSATCPVATDRVLCPADESPSAVDDGVDFDLEPLTGAILWYDENAERVRIQSMMTTYENLGMGAARVVLQRNGSVLEMRRIDGLDGVREAENGNYIEIGLDFTSLNAGTPNSTDVFAFYSGANSRHEKIAYQDLVKFTIVDSGAGSQTVVGDDTITFAGTEGVDLTVSATDTVTASLDINSLTEIGTVDTTADWIVVYDADAGDHKKVHPDDLGIGGGGGSGGTSQWVLYTINDEDFTASATTETIDVATLGQNVYIDEIVYYCEEKFEAGGSEMSPAMTLRLTDGTSTFDSESIPLDAFTRSVCNNIPQRTLLAYGANTVFKAILVDSAVNVVDFTQGKLHVWIKYTALTKP